MDGKQVEPFYVRFRTRKRRLESCSEFLLIVGRWDRRERAALTRDACREGHPILCRTLKKQRVGPERDTMDSDSATSECSWTVRRIFCTLLMSLLVMSVHLSSHSSEAV